MRTEDRPGTGTNQEDVRRHNLGTLLAHVHRAGALTRAELTVLMGLNRSTIGGLLGELERLGLTRQRRPSRSPARAGRPSPIIEPSPSGAHVLAVEMRVGGLTAARIGVGGGILARVSGPLPGSFEAAEVADAVAALVADAEGRPVGSPLIGIGIAIPGLVRRSDGLVRLAPNLRWREVPFAELVGDRLGATVPIRLGNDADLGALAEHQRGAGVDIADLVYLSGEVGVGAGIIVGGHRLDGAGGYAGEFGHLGSEATGRVCHCGSRGCWETKIGARAITEALGCSPDKSVELGVTLARVSRPGAALRSVGRDLGRAIADVVNLLNPGVVVLGGYLRWLYPLVRTEVETELRDRALAASRDQVRLVLPVLGADSVLLGAAEIAFAPMLRDPVGSLVAAPTGLDEG